MSSSARHAFAIVASVCTFGLLAFAPSASASPAPRPIVPTPVPSANVIVIPGPDQVSNTVDAARCPWLTAYTSALTSATGSRSMAVLLAAPLIAAQYSGMADELARP